MTSIEETPAAQLTTRFVQQKVGGACVPGYHGSVTIAIIITPSLQECQPGLGI